MNKKRSIIVIILVFIIVIGIIFYFLNYKKTDESDKTLKKAALDYFDKYVSVYSGSFNYKITLKDLKESQNGYNLENYEKCNDENTYVIITINNINGKVEKTEIQKKCKKG